jgi:predicted  nucleic acid-binding Zn-ribbon protein
MSNNQSKMNALNSQMNTLVETQAQEIKQLKEELSSMTDEKCMYEVNMLDKHTENDELRSRINDLETDRDTMLETCGDLDNMEECVGYVNDLKNDLDDALKNVADTEKELKDEIKELKEMGTEYDPSVDTLVDTEWLEKLQGEINGLKEEKKELNYRIDALSKMNSKKHKYHMNKCEEVKKLKQEVAQKKDAWDGNKILEDLWENTKYGQYFGTAEGTFIEYIQKLEKENEKQEDILVSIQDELLGEVFEPSFHKLLPKIKGLKEE